MTENISFSKLSNYTWDWLDQRLNTDQWEGLRYSVRPIRGQLSTLQCTNYQLHLSLTRAWGGGLGSKHESGGLFTENQQTTIGSRKFHNWNGLIKYHHKAKHSRVWKLKGHKYHFHSAWAILDRVEIKGWQSLQFAPLGIKTVMLLRWDANLRNQNWARLRRGEGEVQGPWAELNYLSQFDIKGSDRILRRALTENCHIHSDADRGPRH